MASSYYIGQTSSDFTGIEFGSTTIGVDGCGICCIAMAICRKASVTSTDGKKAVIDAIIKSGLNGNLLLHSSTVTYNGTKYTVSSTTTKPSSYSNTIIKYSGHYVLALNNTDVEDPGTTSITTVSGADTKYKTHDRYYSVS